MSDLQMNYSMDKDQESQYSQRSLESSLDQEAGVAFPDLGEPGDPDRLSDLLASKINPRFAVRLKHRLIRL